MIESQIDGAFHGWMGDTIYRLVNGQIWRQAEYAYQYHYAYRPTVGILETANGYEMQVEGMPGLMRVERLA
jgi:hypothetical protein